MTTLFHIANLKNGISLSILILRMLKAQSSITVNYLSLYHLYHYNK